MKKSYSFIIITIMIVITIGGLEMLINSKEATSQFSESGKDKIDLPSPDYKSKTSVEEALLKRRSTRDYKDEPLTLMDISQLFWAAQGVTDSRWSLRTAPSAGALYPLEIYLVAGKVTGLAKGVYKYKPATHQLIKIKDGDIKKQVASAALGQRCIENGTVVIVLSAVYERTTKKYGDRGIRYVHMEAGHAAQNIYLQAVSLNLGTVAVGAFKDAEIRKVLSIPESENPLYIMPVGKF
jgi:SagB-type dehydrogenase family enzyme